MDLVELFGLILIVAIVLGFAYLLLFGTGNKNNTKSPNDNTLIYVDSPSSMQNLNLVFNDGESIGFNPDPNQSSLVTLESADLGLSSTVNKIKVNGKYVKIQAKTSNVINPDDNVISFTDDFYFNAPQDSSTPAYASLFLYGTSLCAYFTTNYEYCAGTTDQNQIVFDTTANITKPLTFKTQTQTQN
jgi:hypothetical protein